MDLTKDKLPKVDLILYQYGLMHFSYEDIIKSINNICNSGSKYFLTTTFHERVHNYNITTGKWCTLNLLKSPFELPTPMKIINENCTESNYSYKDKIPAL